MKLLKAYFNYMEDPAGALQSLLAERSFSRACAGYFTAALGWVLFFNIGDGLSVPALLLKLLLVFAAELTAGYFIASVCGLFLDFSRVKASPAELFVLVSSAGFIKGLLIAFALVSAAFPPARLGLLAPLALVLVLALQLGYLTRGLMRAYGMSAGKALGAWLFGFVPAAVAAALAGAFFIWTLTLLF